MGHTANLEFPLETPSVAEAVFHALAPEVEDGPPGTTTTLQLDGTVVRAIIDADDLSGLRAAIHGLARLLDAAQRTLAS